MELKRKALAIAVMIATSTLTACGGTINNDDTAPVTITNSAPTDISLSNASVNENEAGAVIGTLTATDADADDTFTYTLDNANFVISGSELSLSADSVLNFESEQAVTINVTVTDSASATYTKALTINVSDMLDTYTFTSAFVDGQSSVSYSGQTARHVLIAELNHYIGSQLQDDLENGTLTSRDDVLVKLNKYYRATHWDNFPITFIDNAQQSFFAELSNSPKSLSDKMAGNDDAGQHKDWNNGDFAGWGDPDSLDPEALLGPEGLIDLFFGQLADNAEQHLNGGLRQSAAGEEINSVYVNTDGTNLKELIQKFLLVGITYSQATDDYLGHEVEGKGLTTDNISAKDAGDTYSNLEHQFDEGFGYFGAARDYLEYNDNEIAGKVSTDADGRSDWNGEHDSNGDGLIDLKSEFNFGNSTNAAKRDRGTKDNDNATDYTQQIMQAFLAGRNIINANSGATLTTTQMAELLGHRDIAVDGWERAIVSTVIHYINEVRSDLAKMGSDEFSYSDVAKHFSELKGFALGIQFNPYSKVSDEDFAELHSLLGKAPVLEQADVADYQAKLLVAREILATALSFDANNVVGW